MTTENSRSPISVLVKVPGFVNLIWPILILSSGPPVLISPAPLAGFPGKGETEGARRAIGVADSGMNSGTNRDELAKACGKYLLATRMGSVSEIKEEVLIRPGRFKTIAQNLQAKEVIVGNGELRRRYILCFNPREAQRERRHRDQVVKELEEELESHPDRQATASPGEPSTLQPIAGRTIHRGAG